MLVETRQPTKDPDLDRERNPADVPVYCLVPAEHVLTREISLSSFSSVRLL